jgi:hypothetical protein
MRQASAMLVVLTAALAGVLRLLPGLLPAALLLARLVVLAALLVLVALVLTALVLAALVLPALLAGIIGVLIHHLLSCCPRHTIKMIAKQRFQSRQYQHLRAR